MENEAGNLCELVMVFKKCAVGHFLSWAMIKNWSRCDCIDWNVIVICIVYAHLLNSSMQKIKNWVVAYPDQANYLECFFPVIELLDLKDQNLGKRHIQSDYTILLHWDKIYNCYAHAHLFVHALMVL